MASITKFYDFVSSDQGWLGVDDGCAGPFYHQFTAVEGNPSGCLSAVQGSGMAGDPPNCGHYVISGAWTDFGVPSGSIVNLVAMSGVDEFIPLVGDGTLIGPYELYDVSGIFRSTLLSSRGVIGGIDNWQTRTGVFQSVPTDIQTSDSVIAIWLKASSSGVGQARQLWDNVNLGFIYSTPPLVFYSGSSSLNTNSFILNGVAFEPLPIHCSGQLGVSHPVLHASGYLSVPLYHCSGSLSTNSFILNAPEFFDPHRFTGSAALSTKSFQINETGNYIAYTYTGAANLSTQSFILDGNGTATPFSLLKYITNTSLHTNSFQLTSHSGVNSIKEYIGSAFLHTKSFNLSSFNSSFVKAGLNLFMKVASPSSLSNDMPLFIYGDTVSTPRPGGATSPLSGAMDLFILGGYTGGNVSTGLNLFINGGYGTLSKSLPLFIQNNHQILSGYTVPLLISGNGVFPGYVPLSSSMDLFIAGSGTGLFSTPIELTSSMPLFIGGDINIPQLLTSATTLFLQGDEGTSINRAMPLYMSGFAPIPLSGSIPLILPHVNMRKSIPLYIHGF